MYDPPLRFYGFRKGGLIMTGIFAYVDGFILLICIWSWMLMWIAVFIVRFFRWLGRKLREEPAPPAPPAQHIPPRPTRPPSRFGPDGLPTHPVTSDQWRGYSRDLLDD